MRSAAPFAEVSARTLGTAIGSSLGRLRPFATGASASVTTSSRKSSIEVFAGQSGLKLDLVHPAIGCVVPCASALDGSGRGAVLGARNERDRNSPRAVKTLPKPLKLANDVAWCLRACIELRSSLRRAAPHSEENSNKERPAHREPPRRDEGNTETRKLFRPALARARIRSQRGAAQHGHSVG